MSFRTSSCAPYDGPAFSRAAGELPADLRLGIEQAYEAVLRGNLVDARRHLKAALYPNGGADLVALRVRPDLRRKIAAPGAHGQVGQSEADAERAGKASQTKEKAA